MKDDHTQDQEEKFLWVIDKYITRHCHSPKGNDFYRKFYVLFVGYHLKYFMRRRSTAIPVFTSIILCRCSLALRPVSTAICSASSPTATRCFSRSTRW